jgi:anaerobic selenocysteine-containing dehydrogenase
LRRRDFLKTSAVGAGVALLDGCKAEEQQFIVQPAVRPGALQGESIWSPSVCQQCAAGCGIIVRVVDGNAKKIEGNPDHTVNRGGVCALGHSVLQELYNPDRMLDPQRRTGARGDGSFEALTWEEGLAAAVEAIANTPAERIAFIGADRSGLVGGLLRRFAAELGSPPPAFLEAPELEVERRAAQISLGTTDFPYFDIARSDYVLSIGSAMLDRWRSPVHYTRALAEMRRGRPGRRGRFVQAEARMSLTAANADEWLPVRPSAEGVLARAIAGVLLDEGLVSSGGTAAYARLFPDDPPSLEEAVALCDLPVEKIQRVARDLAAAESRLVIGGGSAAAHTNGLFNVVAALGLNVLLDNLGEPGGVFAPASAGLATAIAPAGAEETSMSDLVARMGGQSDDPGAPGGPIDLLFVADADPLHAFPSSSGMEARLANVGTVIALSSFRDDTALEADLVLPLSTELERFSCVEPATSMGVPVVGLTRPVVEPLGNGHHPGDVILALAAALGEPMASAFPWSSFQALARERIEAEVSRLPGGATADASDYYNEALARGGVFGDGTPMTAPPGPANAAPAWVAGTFTGEAAAYPYLVLPFESVKTGHGRGANRPWLQEMPDPMSTVMWNSWAELSPHDAEELGVEDGDLLRLESFTGGIELHAVIDPAARPGVIGVPFGQGHRDYGRYAQGRGANPMDLVGDIQVEGTAAPAWAANRVRVQRLGSGELVRFGRSYEDHGEGENIPVGWAPQVTGGEGAK